MKQNRTDGRQMDFDLSVSSRMTERETEANLCEPSRTARVVPFLDATTLSLRQMAVQSVQRAGIFGIGPLRKS